MSSNTPIRRGLRSVNQRLLLLAGALLVAGIAWGGYQASTGGGADTAPPGLQTRGGTGTSGLIFPEPGADGGYAEAYDKDDVTRGSAVPPGAPSMAPEPMPSEPAMQNVLGRTVIRSGSMELEVESVGMIFDRIRQVAEGHGGFVADSTFGGSAERQFAALTLRVPAERFGQLVEDLRGLAVEVRQISTSSQDITEEFSDLQATIRNLTAVEGQYLSLLSEAQGIGEILQVQDRLNQVRLQIDRTQGRINLLENLSSMATLHVMLTPVSAGTTGPDGTGIGQAIRDAWQSSLETVEAIASAVVFAVVWSWWLLPIAALGALMWRRIGRRPSPAVDTPEGSA
jgi:hypothetical protein